MDATTRRVPGGLPGQSDDWRSWNCWTTGLNDARDMIGVSLADEWMGLMGMSSHVARRGGVSRSGGFGTATTKTDGLKPRGGSRTKRNGCRPSQRRLIRSRDRWPTGSRATGCYGDASGGFISVNNSELALILRVSRPKV